MSAYTELQLLKAEEMVLVKLTSKFSDQLNRLKVEELALLSEIREAGKDDQEANSSALPKEEAHKDEGDNMNENMSSVLDLSVGPSKHVNEDIEEEEDEEDEEEGDISQDPLTAFMTPQQKHQQYT